MFPGTGPGIHIWSNLVDIPKTLETRIDHLSAFRSTSRPPWQETSCLEASSPDNGPSQMCRYSSLQQQFCISNIEDIKFQKAGLLQAQRSIGTPSMVLEDVITVLCKAVQVDVGIRPGSRSVFGGNISAAGSGTQLLPADSLKQAVDIAYGDVYTGDCRNLFLHLSGSGGLTSLCTRL